MPKTSTLPSCRASSGRASSPGVPHPPSPLPRGLRRQILHRLRRGRTPGQVVIQITDRCNGMCPQCGMRRSNRFQRNSLSADQVKRIIDTCAAQGIAALSFTGGEPLLDVGLVTAMATYAARQGIFSIRTGTNGFLFYGADRPDFETRVKKLADRLAESGLTQFWISLDSADPIIHEEMRGLPGIVKGIEKALPFFHERGLYPTANLGINRATGGSLSQMHLLETGSSAPDPEAYYSIFREAFQRFYDFVISLGFTMTSACYPMNVAGNGRDGLRAVYTATSVERIISFSSAEKHHMFKALADTVPDYRSRIRIFTPLASLRSLIRQYAGEGETPYPCRGGIDFFFIDAGHGHVFPCGYRGDEDMGPMESLNIAAQAERPFCTRCDWECFRDPSELVGPLAAILEHPIKAFSRSTRTELIRLWREDLRYSRACGYFNGRTPPNEKRLAAFRIEPRLIAQNARKRAPAPA